MDRQERVSVLSQTRQGSEERILGLESWNVGAAVAQQCMISFVATSKLFSMINQFL